MLFWKRIFDFLVYSKFRKIIDVFMDIIIVI